MLAYDVYVCDATFYIEILYTFPSTEWKMLGPQLLLQFVYVVSYE